MDTARIVRTPGVLGGKPRITGHRISVQDVAIWHNHMKLSADEIAAKYDLSPDDVQAALTYYVNHRIVCAISLAFGAFGGHDILVGTIRPDGTTIPTFAAPRASLLSRGLACRRSSFR